MDYVRETADSIQDSVRPNFKVQPYSDKTPYRQWIESEKIPIYTGMHISDVRALSLGPWERLGAHGAHVVLEGAEGTDGAYLVEVPAGGSTKAQRYLFEEVIYVLEGEGEATVWHDRGNKHSFQWSKGALFSPPLNVWREHVNRGSSPARLIAVNDLPIVMDLFHNAQFIFNNDFIFTDRYGEEGDFFECGPHKIRKGRAPGVTQAGKGGDSYECSLIPDARTLALFDAPARGRKNR